MTGNASREDEMVDAIITHYQTDDLHDEVAFHPETPYNNYGERGVVDLYMTLIEDSGNPVKQGVAIEVKADPAVQQATGANEILRQYNRMRKNFFADETRTVPKYGAFELCFVVSPVTVEHVAENLKMYQSASKSRLNPVHEDNAMNSSGILFRNPDPNEYQPAPLPADHLNIDTPSGWRELLTDMPHPAPTRVASILESLGY
jgi:hypothetical protein